jgi:cell division protein FtsL
MRFVLVLLGLMVFGSALVVVDTAQRDRDLTRTLSEHRLVIQKLNVTYAELQLEEGALASQGRVDQIAQSRLFMHAPDANQVTMVFR